MSFLIESTTWECWSGASHPDRSVAKDPRSERPPGVPGVAQWVKNLTSILASLSGLRIQRCGELLHRSQIRLRSGVAVAVAVV